MSGKPIDEAALTTVSFLDGGVVQMDRADYDRLTAAQQQGQGGGERKGCGDPTCGCDWPSFTEPMEALRFLSGRMKYAGIAEGVARSYARDIDDILAKYDTEPPSAPVGVELRGVADTLIAAANNPVSSGGGRGLRDLMKAQASRLHALAQQPAAREEMSPEFTDSARAAIAWVLYHHQGGSSPVGQPLRFALGMGADEPLPDWRIAEAKRWAEWAGAATADFHRQQPAAVDEAMVERGTAAAIAASTRHARTSAVDAWRQLVREVLAAALAAQHQEPKS